MSMRPLRRSCCARERTRRQTGRYRMRSMRIRSPRSQCGRHGRGIKAVIVRCCFVVIGVALLGNCKQRVDRNIERRHAGRGLVQVGRGPGIEGKLAVGEVVQIHNGRLEFGFGLGFGSRVCRLMRGGIRGCAAGRMALRRRGKKRRRLGRIAGGAGRRAAWRGACMMGRVTKSSAGTDAGAGVVAGAGAAADVGFGPAERTPPPMSSSAVQGRSLITSSRLNANRSSSPSSNARFACLAAETKPPRPLRDALLDPILFHPFELSISSIIWNLLRGRVLDSCILELTPKRGEVTRPSCLLVAGRQPLPR